jgi:hypothetical protein
MAGRPSKLTPALQAKLCDAIRSGNFLETAASFAGIDKSTLHRWLKRGDRERRGACHDFAAAVDKAVADSQALAVARIAKAANDGNWQASAWLLERRFPENWGRRDRHEIKADINSTVTVSHGDEAIEKINRLLAARNSGSGETGSAERAGSGGARGAPA